MPWPEQVLILYKSQWALLQLRKPFLSSLVCVANRSRRDFFFSSLLLSLSERVIHFWPERYVDTISFHQIVDLDHIIYDTNLNNKKNGSADLFHDLFCSASTVTDLNANAAVSSTTSKWNTAIYLDWWVGLLHSDQWTHFYIFIYYLFQLERQA